MRMLRQEQKADICKKLYISGKARVMLKFATSLDKRGSKWGVFVKLSKFVLK
jgi:hypothetical protein